VNTKQARTLERDAIRAHARGDTWATFWTEHGAAVCAAEPHSRERFQRLVRRLLSLITSGDTDGMEPAGEPWLLGEQQEPVNPSDTSTQARCLWPMVAAALPYPPRNSGVRTKNGRANRTL
jgi:hypothetical protein